MILGAVWFWFSGGALRVAVGPHNPVSMDSANGIEQFGPKMSALTDLQRRYVLAMLSDPLGNPTLWARAAGYSDKSQAAKVKGHYLSHDDRVMEAAQEEARRHLDTVGPVLGIGVMIQIARTKGHKRQLEAAAMLADRVKGFATKTEHNVNVSHKLDDAQIEDFARRLAAENGIDVRRLLGGPVIEAEVVSTPVGLPAGTRFTEPEPGKIIVSRETSEG